MKRFLSVSVVLLAACGGGNKNQPTVTDNTAGGDDTATRPADTGGDAYGGGTYGGAAYGGGTYGGEGGMVDEGPVAPNPLGHWVSKCMPGAKKGESGRLVFDILPTRWQVAIEAFRGNDCKKRMAVVHLGGAWTMLDASTTVPGAWNAMFAFETRTLTTDDAKAAKAYGKLCGVKKLKAKKAADIHAPGCPALGLRPAASCAEDHDLVAVVDGKLQLGVRPADNDTCTAEKRPTALDASLELTFQWKSFGITECDAAAASIEKARACQAVPPEAKTMIDEQLRYLWTMVAPAGDPAASTEDKGIASSQCAQIQQGIDGTLAQLGC